MLLRTLVLALAVFASAPASALYDPKPNALLEPAIGRWAGTLTYRDYQQPDKMVTLNTTMTATLAGPNQLTLYYVFDDGPGKTVYSYESMQFDLDAKKLVWISGANKPERSTYTITASSLVDGIGTMAFEKKSDDGINRFRLELSASQWLLEKNEVDAAGTSRLRNCYLFKRP